MFEIIFGSFILAPELLPLAILTLAGIWYVREHGQRVKQRIRARLRLARAADDPVSASAQKQPR